MPVGVDEPDDAVGILVRALSRPPVDAPVDEPLPCIIGGGQGRATSGPGGLKSVLSPNQLSMLGVDFEVAVAGLVPAASILVHLAMYTILRAQWQKILLDAQPSESPGC